MYTEMIDKLYQIKKYRYKLWSIVDTCIILIMMALQGLTAVVLSLLALTAAQDCNWSTNNDLPSSYQALYIKPGGSLDIRGFWLPQSGDVVTVPEGDEVLFACPGGNLGSVGGSQATLTCSGGRWSDGGSSYSFSQLSCSSHPAHTARFTGGACDIAGPYQLVEVGFELSNGDFYKLMETCLEQDTSDSLYSVFLQVPEIGGYQSGQDRPSFTQGSGFYPSGMDVDELYTQVSQRAAVAEAVGSDTLAGQYIQEGTEYFMSRGHLSANGDFIYGAHQRATFYFMNVAPQWQTFNGQNWATLENNCRSYVKGQSKDIFVYTGTHGTTTLTDINGDEAPIYLDFGNKFLKSPQMFWKVLFEPETGRGVAFAGLNNPYIDNPGNDFYVCPDVCSQLTWLTWKPNDQEAGYTYCCEVDALAAVVTEIPPLPVTGLLT